MVNIKNSVLENPELHEIFVSKKSKWCQYWWKFIKWIMVNYVK